MLNFLGALSGLQQPGIEGMGGLEQSIAQNNAAGAAMPPPKPKKQFADSTFGRIMGMIGDALLANSGRAPMYAPQLQQMHEEARQQQGNEAMANYLGNIDPGLRDLIMAAGPQAGMQAYGIAHPKAENEPSFIQEWRIRNGLPPEEQQSLDSYAEKRKFNPYAAPITLGPGDTFEGGPGGGEDMPTVATPEEAGQLPPGTRFRMPDGRIGTVPGGPTGDPSVPFP